MPAASFIERLEVDSGITHDIDLKIILSRIHQKSPIMILPN